ncbi:MAG: hypothetical protein ACPHER_01565, partial [Nevskiales bacterium]
MSLHRYLLVTLFVCLISACGGESDGQPYGGSEAAGGTGGGTPTSSSFANSEEFFAARVGPRMGFCRTCHIPGGVADTPDGERFMLSSNSGDDYANTLAAWELLGEGVEDNLLIVENSDNTEPHSGGKNWPVGSDAYNDMVTLLGCWDDPLNCVLNAAGNVLDELPLLGSKRGRHIWQTYCTEDTDLQTPGVQARPDSAILPPDPRTQVVPGANEGLAVHFNGFWEDCHVNLPEEEQAPKTCGTYRQRRDSGLAFFMDELPSGAKSAEEYNNSWEKWGLSERPANFDEMYRLRYGMNEAPFHNPYPLPDEDPNASNGGSGVLPLGMRQLKDDEGKWTGQIATGACFTCHGGGIGEGADGLGLANLGLGNANYDNPINGTDNAPFPVPLPVNLVDVNSLFNIGIRQRGQNNAVGAFLLLVLLLDVDSLGFNPLPTKIAGLGGPDLVFETLTLPLAHTQDTPAWWNTGSRPRKFFDAGVSSDSTRIDMAAGFAGPEQIISPDGNGYRGRIEKYDQDVDAYFLSLESPEYPREVDTALAEQGAVLFHSKDLWAANLDNPVPRPAGGNGSCASCHGAYSPRYVNDPAYLEDPSLEGVASHIATLDVIGTDRARSDMLAPALRTSWDKTFWGYQDGLPGWTAPEDKDPFTEASDDSLPNRPVGVCGWQKEVIGYQAPPLYGTWATAPYLHNGSVPTIEQLLDSSKRPNIWRRQLKTLGPVTGFDQDIDSAYDFEHLGWKHTALSCDEMPGGQMNCNPADPEGGSFQQVVQGILNGLGLLGLAQIPDPSPEAVEKRFIYDSRTQGNGNGGHTFTDVLTDAERKA